MTLFALPSDSIAVTSDDCYTPRWVFDAMGLQFDLDVAAPPGGPWHVPAKRWYTAEEDGLVQPWDGLVWCNPPYSNFRPWAERWSVARGCLMGHYTPGTSWTPIVLANADAVAFLTVEFVRPDGGTIRPRAGLFVAFRGVGPEPAERLAAADRYGAVLYGRPVRTEHGRSRRAEPPKVTDTTPIGPDVDLSSETVHTKTGTPVTDTTAAEYTAALEDHIVRGTE